MFIDKVPNRGSRPTILLREAHREGEKTFKTTLANLTHWPPERVEALDCFLKGKTIPASADSLTTAFTPSSGNSAHAVKTPVN